MALATGAERRVAGLGDLVGLGGDSRPVVHGVSKPWVAGGAHDDGLLLAAATGHRSDACKGSECRVLSGLERPCCFAEQRRRHDHADPWHGLDDRDVALLVLLPRRRLRGHALKQSLEAGLAALELLVDQAHSFGQQLEMSDGCRGGARGRVDGSSSQVREDRLRVEPADPVVLEEWRTIPVTFDTTGSNRSQ